VSYVLLFVANVNPWISALAKGTSTLIKSSTTYTAQIPRVLALMANVCLALCKSKEYDEATTNKFLVAMAASIVVYDHVVPDGAFTAKGLNVKSASNLIVKDYPQSNLANALKYSTLHYADDNTPASIKSILESA
jgi:hypothetical protein